MSRCGDTSRSVTSSLAMNGSRSPQKAQTIISPQEILVHEEGLLREVAADKQFGMPEPGAVDAYLSARKLLH